MLLLMNEAERSLSSTYVKEKYIIQTANIYECDFGDIDGIYICKCGIYIMTGLHTTYTIY